MPGASSTREQRLQEVLVSVVEASEAGQAPDVAALQARYPEFASEVAEFCAGRQHVDQLALPLRQALAGTATVGHATDAERQLAGTPRVRYFGDYELLDVIARGGM